ncbi:MAG: CBS domain-containing protein [Candidatus Omnitrophica bacterium]|nr:CBS domain-containing protein [Candidatus Omnitrophota bacterium]
MLNLPISDIMNDHPIKVLSDVTIRNVAHLMLRYRINGILVVDRNDAEKLCGVFTTTDLMNVMGGVLAKRAKKMQALNELGEKPIGAYLSKDFVTMQKDDSAAKAVGLMHKKNVLTIPVYDGDKLVGVIGRHDVINIAFA